MTDLRAVLVLEDGSVWEGRGFGAPGRVAGEVVFNTGMVGYPESITDPSYHGQILCQTYPLIGNYGVDPGRFESSRPRIQGYVVGELCPIPSHRTSKLTLEDWLEQNGVPGLQGIDTRALTKRLRVKGVMPGVLEVSDTEPDLERLRALARRVPDPQARHLVAEVTTPGLKIYNAGSRRTVVLLDCGVKESIIRCLVRRKLRVVRMPAHSSAREIMAHSPVGIVISNGPGDPKMCRETVEAVRTLMKERLPLFGICLGNQILALAAGGRTYKLKFGHRGQNQPCLEVGTKRCFITSQNHGYAVDTDSLPSEWRPWFTNANDQTNEGLLHRSGIFSSVQFHPEAAPGPADTEFLFDAFVERLP
jgi:carbamoyl-phosphate synthase small subunit